MLNETRKGQLTILSLVMFFVMVFVFTIMLAPLKTFISIGVNATNGTAYGDTMALLLNNLPVMIGLVIIITLFVMVSIYRAQ